MEQLHHLAKFIDDTHCGSGDVMVLVCPVISQDHVIKGSVTLWVGVHQDKLPFFQVCWP